ncbi:glycosyltransferase family 4 protein [Myroides phaeus]|uniref:Glycosyltransferase involved in cell wall bisynthesis n=1 Tax=Myroides phaeus TaxID=702745 RepID=A0A1G8B503_9FLAO|nr:glycosyltransferase family 4 protein [Myroides phaeus]SDH28221.1 Glycosyltransferase involved in cell wall bisynthesis [Myroides phaeus]
MKKIIQLLRVRMNLAIITSRYPKGNQPYNHMFVHVRALYFVSKGINVTVFVPSNKTFNYEYQGVNVVEDVSKNIIPYLDKFDVLYLHLLNQYPTKSGGFSIYNEIRKKKYPTALYFHGSDGLIYPKYFYDFKFTFKGVFKYLYTNTWKRYFVWRFLKSMQSSQRDIVMAPSVWLSEQLEKIYKLKADRIKVVPNGIDTSMFNTNEAYMNRFKILCIRPLNDSYPVDDCIRLMTYLPDIFTLDIYGQGYLKDKLNKLIIDLRLSSRVRIINEFIPREKMNSVFRNYGIYNALSKLDTQGVSMCEALAAKLLVISTNKTCIPEFISDNHTGLLDNDLERLAKRICEVCEDELYFNEIISNARLSMESIAVEKVGSRELNLLKLVGGIGNDN